MTLGWSQGATSAVGGSLKEIFMLAPFELGLLSGIYLLGAMIGGLIGNTISNKIGRKKVFKKFVFVCLFVFRLIIEFSSINVF